MTTDHVVVRHRHLEQIAMITLEIGRLLVETGAKTSVAVVGMRKVAEGLGAEHAYCRVGYTSSELTVTHGENTITRMIAIGPHGVNMRLNHEVRELCRKAERGELGLEEVRADLDRMTRNAPHYPRALIAVSSGVACAAFGRLLGVDWLGVVPIFVASTSGQFLRVSMVKRGVNAFVITAIVAFAASILAGTLANLAGSMTVSTAMTASVLLLVPGIPAMNAQTDIMEGFPTMGSARFVTVAMMILFITLGLGAAQAVTHGGMRDMLQPHHDVLHQAFFGAVAAAGFGVLFNFGLRRLIWSGAAGAVALSVRTVALQAGWPLEAASFAAAATAALAVELLRFGPFEVRRPRSMLAIAGCIPMIPGSAATAWIIGLLELTSLNSTNPAESLQVAASAGLRVVFTIGAVGAALTMVRSLVPHSEFP